MGLLILLIGGLAAVVAYLYGWYRDQKDEADPTEPDQPTTAA